MIHHTWIRIRRKPWFAAAVTLFAAIITAALCGLYSSAQQARQHYEKIYAQIPVHCTVTNLAGNQSDRLGIPVGLVSLFTGAMPNTPTNLMDLVEDVQIKGSTPVLWNGQEYTLTGITSLEAAPALWPENNCTIFWNVGTPNEVLGQEGDSTDGTTTPPLNKESIFHGSEMVCLLPEELAEKMKKMGLWYDDNTNTANVENSDDTEGLGTIKNTENADSVANSESSDSFPSSAEPFLSLHIPAISHLDSDYYGSLQVAGTYQGNDQTTIYCPWDTYVTILRTMGRYEEADSLSATLRNNDDLARLRQAAATYFATPDPDLAGMDMMGDYYLALDIDTSGLTQAQQSLEQSLRTGKLASAAVFLLSAVSGALVGFLMIRSRRRDIALMQTLGTPMTAIYLSFAWEQMVCAIFGTVLGGVLGGVLGRTVFSWQPTLRLLLFLAVYFLGLSLALILSLRRNLLTSIKEDE